MDVVNSLKGPERQQQLLAAFKFVADSGYYTEGAYTFKLEQQMSKLVNNQHAVTFNSDGSAWYTLFRYYHTLGHRSVAICDNSFHAVGAMALMANLHVYLIDCLPDQPSMSAESLYTVLDSPGNTCRLVILSHCAGWVAPDSHAIQTITSERDAILIEDCTDIMGLAPTNSTDMRPGRFGEAAIWSFYPSKAVPAGECGMLTTISCVLRDFARLYRSYGKHMIGGDLHYGRGLGMKISEWEAAVASVQLDNLPHIMAARARDAEALQSIAPCLLQGPTNWYKYPIDIEYAAGHQLANQCYSRSEQLHACLPVGHVSQANLVNSFRWSQRHRCLPIGEGIYDGKGQEEMEKMLKKQ